MDVLHGAAGFGKWSGDVGRDPVSSDAEESHELIPHAAFKLAAAGRCEAERATGS